MKILHVVNVYFSLAYFGNHFKHLNNYGHKIYLAISPDKRLQKYSKENQITSLLEVPILRKISIIQDILSIIEIMQFAKANEIDIIVGHTPKGAFLSMTAGKLLGIRERIYYRHGLLYETSNYSKKIIFKSLEKLTSLFATRIVNVSNYLNQKAIIDKLNKPEKQLIIGKGSFCGIDTDFLFNPNLMKSDKKNFFRKKYEISEKDFVIGYCGRLTKDKGINELIEAFTVLKKTIKNIKLLLIGDYDSRDFLSSQNIEKIESDINIIKTGFIDKDINYHYSLMNIFVFPSYREGFGLSVLEASAMEIPALVTGSTGCAETIIHGQTGFYISNSSSNIIEMIKFLKESKNLKKMGAKGRDFVCKNFNSKLNSEMTNNILYGK